MEFEDGTKDIIGVFYEVYNTLGCGYLEKVYENALALEFARRGLKFERQAGIKILYKGDVAGDYVADFIIGDVVIEVKAKRFLDEVDEAQLINYLKGTGKKVGLLVNFGEKKLNFERRVYGF